MSRKEGEKKSMSEKEKSIIAKIAQAVPKMSEFDKGYLLGKAETLADETVKRGKEDAEHSDSGN